MKRCICHGTPPPLVHLNIKAAPAYRDWVNEFAKSRGLSASELTETAIRTYAARFNYPAPPDRTGASCHA